MYTINDSLHFGKYEGFTIKEIFCGQKYLTQNFINDFLEFKLKDLKFDIESNLKQEDVQVLIKDFEVLINNELTLNVELNTNNNTQDKTIYNALDWIGYHLCLDDSKEGMEAFGSPNDCIEAINNSNGFKHKPSSDAQYIDWCVQNLDTFFLAPDDLMLLQFEKCYHFYGVQLFTAPPIYHYKLNCTITTYKFDDKTIAINKKKFDTHNLKKLRKRTSANTDSFDENANVSYSNLNDPQYSDGYGGYLT